MNKNIFSTILISLFFIIMTMSCTSSVSKEEVHAKHGHNHETDKKTKTKNIDKLLVEGEYHQAQFCPNSSVFVYTSENGDDLYIKYDKHKEGKKILTLKGAGNNIGWNKNCNRIYYKEKLANYKIVVKSIDINTLDIQSHPEYDPGVILNGIGISDTAYNIDLNSHDIYANYKGNDFIVNKKKGNYYKLLLNPNNKNFIIHEGSQIQLFSLNGDFIKSLGKGIATQWASDGQSLIGFLDKSENGHSVSSSELYQFFINDTPIKQLTFTEDIFEMWPTIGTNKEIIYTDGLNGGIYKSNIQL